MRSFANAHVILRDRYQRFGIALDESSGLPEALLLTQGQDEIEFPLRLSAEIVTGGREVRDIPSRFLYIDADHFSTFERAGTAPVYYADGPQETYVVATQVANWNVLWHYTLRQQHPRIEISFEIGPARSTEQIELLRDARLQFYFSPTDLASWLVEVPGNKLRAGFTADVLKTPVTVNSIGEVAGSTGTVVLHHPAQRHTLVLWPFSRTEIGSLRLQTHDDGLRFSVDTGVAGKLKMGDRLHYRAIEIDALASSWEEVRAEFPTWYNTLGLHTPLDRAEWIKTASIYEVQIGYSVFWGDYRYSPYPTVRDLINDLGRIKGLGYTMLQIMPRQPYPSYNVHDYDDITTSYGDEADLRELVRTAHALGMRVILDILLHGVMDQEVITETAKRVRSSRYYARITEQTSEPFSTRELEAISWSRHILDFEPYWFGGSPPRHHLADEHPEWFMRDSEQHIIGIYTKAFDVANVDWQEYFCQACVRLVERLDIDGFRFDAPTYNDLPNWSKATARRASYSPLGCLELFEKLRPRLKEVKESIMLYTEPSGVAFRQSMDVTYNYDEQWLIKSVLQPKQNTQKLDIGVRSGRELAAWFRDRNALLPAGSLIAHHIDSHDTFWWPLPGAKWRREQYGIPATRALLSVFSLSGGAYMTFVGGEEGIEDEVKRVHHLRSSQPEIGLGIANYDAVSVDQDAIYAVARQHERDCSIVLVNLSNQPLEAVCSLDEGALGLDEAEYFVYDAWNDQALRIQGRYAVPHAELRQLTLSFEPFQTRVLTLKHASVRATSL